jgi:hypothetical protein
LTFYVIEYSAFTAMLLRVQLKTSALSSYAQAFPGKREAPLILGGAVPFREVAKTSEEWLRAARLASDKMRISAEE